jgi:hypothetical protein
MRYAPLWQQAGSYPASTDRGLMSTLWPSSGSTGGAVTTVANTMNVSVAPGTAAVVCGTYGTELCRWDANEVVTLQAAPVSGSSRIDLIVLQVRDNALDSGGNNDFIFQAIAGTVGTPGPGAVPAVPANAYAVAQLTIAGGIANLNGVTVTDLRIPYLSGMSRLIGRSYLTANTTAVSAATDTGQTVTANTKAGRRYTVKWTGLVNSTVGADKVQVGAFAGATQLGVGSTTVVVASNAYTLSFEAPYDAGADAAGLVFKAQISRVIGTGNVNIVAGATYPSVLAVYDDGLP